MNQFFGGRGREIGTISGGFGQEIGQSGRDWLRGGPAHAVPRHQHDLIVAAGGCFLARGRRIAAHLARFDQPAQAQPHRPFARGQRGRQF